MSRSSVALNRLRACAILSLLAFHSVMAYLGSLPATPYPFDSPPYRWAVHPMIDPQRWFGFDIFCASQDIYLMSLMFFLSGVFVWRSLARKGEAAFVQGRIMRLCVPAGLAVLLMMRDFRLTALLPVVPAGQGPRGQAENELRTCREKCVLPAVESSSRPRKRCHDRR